MPKTKKNKTRRFVVKKGLVGGPLSDEAMRFLAHKGLTKMDLIRSIADADGALKRGTKTMGPFLFTIIPMSSPSSEDLAHLGGVYIYVSYKDNLKDKAMI